MRKKLKDVEGITPYDMIAHLPMECCFFDSRHHIVGRQVLPFAVTTRIGANNQQYLFEIYETDSHPKPTMHIWGDSHLTGGNDSQGKGL